ncbi:MAG: EndoU domain-containing protein [Bdellovibrionales bacterium]
MKAKRAFLGVVCGVVLLCVYLAGSAYEFSQNAQADINAGVVLTQDRIDHILYGNESGGGHKHGVGTPCKSEFPADWDDDKIIAVVKTIAANDNADWRQEANGYYVTEAMEGETQVRVVIDGEKQRVITSYPVNVARNPCPPREAANDN